MAVRLSVFLLSTLLTTASCFCPVPHGGSNSVTSSRSGGSRLHAIAPPPIDDIESSRTAFFIWFFGASGAAGIARSAFPRMYDSVMEIQSLKGLGPTLGGPGLGLSPLVGYPEDIRVKDIEKIVNNKLNVEQIVEKYPIPDNFLSSGGYLTYKAFVQANKDANPLALRAIFDTFAQSTDACSPIVAQEKIDLYKTDVNAIKGGLLKSKLTGFSAIALLLFLLGLADIVAAGHAYHGWFPDWPGGQNFPWCFFDLETGPWTIPQYWLSEVPEKL